MNSIPLARVGSLSGYHPVEAVVVSRATEVFTYASSRGSLGVAAVLSSLYPVLIARVVLHERLCRVPSRPGAVLTLVCVAVVAFSASR
ncbi:hypothetical protein HNP40_003676 [Mycobacteroides chelonae]|nr:hypothetical protein [Mycobacteroides chelonae]